jgi:hypothetical protein
LSWLRDHFHRFVFPAFVAAGKKSTEIGEPFDVRPSPHAPERLPPELRKLWTLCKEHEVPFEYDVREVNLYGGTSKYRERAKVDHGVLNSTLDSAMAALRAERCDRLFLGGRDVWAFAVMCERRRIPYMFVPELSRHVSSRPEVRPFLEARGFTGNELFLDTGYAGSIPRNLQAHFGRTFKFRLMSQTEQFVATMTDTGVFVDQEPGKGVPPRRAIRKERWKRYPNQLFPNRKTAREEAMFQEYVAKFWRSGTFSQPVRSAPMGQVNEVFKEWLHKPKVWRYDDAHKRILCLTDGVDAVCVGLSDVKLQPGFYEWWKSLPKGPAWVPPDHKMGEIVQYLADKQSIQRAALLTSQIWRGIPTWKAMSEPREKDGPKIGPVIVNTAGIGNLTFDSSNTITTSTNSTATYVNMGVWLPGQAAPQAALAAAGMTMVKGQDDENGMPTLEVVKQQLDLFTPAELHQPEKPEYVQTETGQLGFPEKWAGDEMAGKAKVYVFPSFDDEAVAVTI